MKPSPPTDSEKFKKKIVEPEFINMILHCLSLLFSGHISSSDRSVSAKWAGLPEDTWDKSHWTIFSIAMLHYCFEEGEGPVKWIEARIITIVLSACVLQVLDEFKEGQLSEKVYHVLGYCDDIKLKHDLMRFQKELSKFEHIGIVAIGNAAENNAVLKEALQKAYAYGNYILREKLPPFTEIKNIPSTPVALTDSVRDILYNLVLKLEQHEKK